MASAASTPTPTVNPGLGRSELVMAWPLSEMCTAGPSADSAALIRFWASAVVTWASCLSQVTTAKATVPSRLTCAAPALAYGLATDSTPGTAATLASAALTAARTVADWIVAPWVAWITTWSPSPDADGKFCVSKLTAACESVFGRLKLPPKALPSCGADPDHRDHDKQPGDHHPPAVLKAPAT